MQNKLKTEISIHGRVPAPFSKQKITAMIREILAQAKIDAQSIGLSFAGQAKMQTYNRAYRKKNKPTDVLSFAYAPRRKSEGLEGDIIICPAYVKQDIKNSDTPFTEQMKRLLVHGVLHLAGMDHAKEADAKKMFTKQEKILRTL
ncbi:rRNA maturation RNase YbeY [Candidatus Uhrbacteria bacterium]|nr:rRNA maturation RNase YbeY [Candidatus Uhrbacteria bacterium]